MSKTITLYELAALIDEIRHLNNIALDKGDGFKYTDEWYRLEELNSLSFVMTNTEESK